MVRNGLQELPHRVAEQKLFLHRLERAVTSVFTNWINPFIIHISHKQFHTIGN